MNLRRKCEHSKRKSVEEQSYKDHKYKKCLTLLVTKKMYIFFK